MTTHCCAIALVLFCVVPRPASAQSYPPAGIVPGTDVVTYYDADAVGSIRMITDASGAIVARYDYLPFGTPWAPVSAPTGRLFSGKEHDTATGLEYYGARHLSAPTGRFTSPDPVTVDAVRLVNPQRWGRYPYALNNPLRFGDPDGRDVIIFNFIGGAFGFGHVGILALDRDGGGLYGSLNPYGNPIRSAGTAQTVHIPQGSIKFGPDGRPTEASLKLVKRLVATVDMQNPSPLLTRTHYQRTTDAETAAMKSAMTKVEKSSSTYNFFTNNCLVYVGNVMALSDDPFLSGFAELSKGFVIPNEWMNSLKWADFWFNSLLGPAVTVTEEFQGVR